MQLLSEASLRHGPILLPIKCSCSAHAYNRARGSIPTPIPDNLPGIGGPLCGTPTTGPDLPAIRVGDHPHPRFPSGVPCPGPRGCDRGLARPSRRVFQCHRPGRVHHAPREGPSWGLEPCPVPRPAPAGVHTGLLTGRTLKDGHARRARRCRDPGRDRAPGSNWHAGYLTPVAHALFGPEVAAGRTPRQRPSHKLHPASADRGAMRAAASGAVPLESPHGMRVLYDATCNPNR